MAKFGSSLTSAQVCFYNTALNASGSSEVAVMARTRIGWVSSGNVGKCFVANDSH